MPLVKISIIVPIYNVEKYLHRCIESIVNQTYNDIEIILVDDGSTDGSLKICKEYADKDSRIKIIHQTNRGLVSARKAGIRIAQGQYIGFVDGDDYVEANMYEVLLGLIENQKVDFVHSGYYKNESQVNRGGEAKRISCASPKQKESVLKELVLDQTNRDSVTPSIWSKLFKKEVIYSAYMRVDNANSYGEDLLCLCHCVNECDSFYIENQCFYHYVVREDSMSHQGSMSALMREVTLYNTLQQLAEADFSNFELRSSIERYFFNCLIFRMNQLSIIKSPMYLLNNIEQFYDKSIILYGAGQVGQDYYLQLSLYKRCHVVAWVDQTKEKDSFDYCSISRPEEILQFVFDYILVAVLNEGLFYSIREELIQKGIEERKIVWVKPDENYFEGEMV